MCTNLCPDDAKIRAQNLSKIMEVLVSGICGQKWNSIVRATKFHPLAESVREDEFKVTCRSPSSGGAVLLGQTNMLACHSKTPFVNSSACSSYTSRFNYCPFYSQNMSMHEDDFRFALDEVVSQQLSYGDTVSGETGSSVADLESTLDSTAVPATIFETLGGSSVMLDLYDVFANPSSFPFPPEVDRSNVCPVSMDIDLTPCSVTQCRPGEQLSVRLSNATTEPTSQGQYHQTTSGTCSPSERHGTTADVADTSAGSNVYSVEQEGLCCATSRAVHRVTSSTVSMVCSDTTTTLNPDVVRRYRRETMSSQTQSTKTSCSDVISSRSQYPHPNDLYAFPTPPASTSQQLQFTGYVDSSSPPMSPPVGHFRFPPHCVSQSQCCVARPTPRLNCNMASPVHPTAEVTNQMSPIMAICRNGPMEVSETSELSGTASTTMSPVTPSTPTSSVSSSSCETKIESRMKAQSAVKEYQQCAVCGDNAICQHYGVRTCEGCKGFFKRTVQKGSKYTCLANRSCVIDKRHRNRCQFCRFQKCLSVGMVREVVRTDTLKGRRGRLPSKPRSPSEPPLSPPVSLVTALVRAHVDTSPAAPDFDYSQYGQSPNDEFTRCQEETIQHFYDTLISSIDTMRLWADKVPGFTELSKADQDLLFQSAALELVLLRVAYGSRLESGDERVVFCNGRVLHREQCLTAFGANWFEAVSEFGAALRHHSVDISIFACMSALSLVTHRHGVQNAKRVDEIQTRIIDTLRDHCTYNVATQRLMFARVLGLLPQLRTLSRLGVDRLNDLKRQGEVDQLTAVSTPASPHLDAANPLHQSQQSHYQTSTVNINF